MYISLIIVKKIFFHKQALYEQSLQIKSAIPHPLIMGVIRGNFTLVWGVTFFKNRKCFIQMHCFSISLSIFFIFHLYLSISISICTDILYTFITLLFLSLSLYIYILNICIYISLHIYVLKIFSPALIQKYDISNRDIFRTFSWHTFFRM